MLDAGESMHQETVRPGFEEDHLIIDSARQVIMQSRQLAIIPRDV
ncbi:hypothetical protein DE4585_01631 [Mycobacteroides salmoniphilum]|uniref:Uncharacterized protein n=1 Tax=Mycobacteroides salmoniphilum TaxID=404941 RepID=A0A4R8S5U7_9MYCO|nr:hypothetical protein DE4586_03159 [Mycobacteroides salmoniphilum]TDZ82839.1 hypothetical protein DE4585_01631 [Mycobacteroides salmoniphilum]TDZ83788.1 hypothetical protein DE4587_02701 [Mycobacteroides salmoniphilum]